MTGTDPYLDPKTGVLKNRLGITDQSLLDTTEAEFATLRIADLEVNPLPGNFDLKHFCTFHRRIFGDIYAWAGEVRTVQISKSAAPFCLAQFIEEQALRLFSALQDDELSSASTIAAEQLAGHLAEINALHPFREGNGRTQRSFIRLWASQFGWTVDWSQLDKDEHDRAYEASFVYNDSAPLTRIIQDRLVAI